MIIKRIEIQKFRSFENVSFDLGRRITAISGRNATQKTTVLGMIGQPFTISKDHAMYGCKTIDGYNFRSQFKDKFKISPEHDIIGEHRWKLILHNHIYEQPYFSVESIARNQTGRTATLRFWNAESRAKGAGYIQLPVYFLSLSRLFPIGEGGRTKSFQATLTPEELEYCITHYRTILSIQTMRGIPSIGIEKGTSSRTFAGVSDDIHDIFTNSAGEGNIMRIILAVLSFRRLKEQYPQVYKGGILLIDELDATLYGFSQSQLVEYLWNAANDYKIQIVFTTHSPIVLKSVSKFLREERQKKGIDLPTFAYDSSIVYLEPNYDEEGNRRIMPENIATSDDLNRILNDINLRASIGESKIRLYFEDMEAHNFVRYLLSETLEINLELFMTFVDADLGWSNYIQLANKRIPEFCENIIILDGDVCERREYNESKRAVINSTGNFLFLPLVIEKDMFVLLKDHAAFIRFQNFSPRVASFTYDVCFNRWALDARNYSTVEFKEWYDQVKAAVGDPNILYAFWCSEYPIEARKFVDQFSTLFNRLADKLEIDAIPLSNYKQKQDGGETM